MHRWLVLTGWGTEVQLAVGCLAFAAFNRWCGLVAAFRAVTTFAAFAAITVAAAALAGCAFLAAVRAGGLLAAQVGAGFCALNTFNAFQAFYAFNTHVRRALFTQGGGAALGGGCFVATLVAAATAFTPAFATCFTWLALFANLAAGFRGAHVTA